MMSRTPIRLLLVLLLVPASAIAAPESLQDGAVKLDTPHGFSPLSHGEIAEIFTRGNAPDAAYGNDDRSVTVTVQFSSELQPEQLPLLKTEMEKALKVQSDLQWITSELMEANDRRWVHFEVESIHGEDPAHNHIYLTSHRGKMIAFGFNAKAVAYDAHAQALEKTFRSIRLEE